MPTGAGYRYEAVGLKIDNDKSIIIREITRDGFEVIPYRYIGMGAVALAVPRSCERGCGDVVGAVVLRTGERGYC